MSWWISVYVVAKVDIRQCDQYIAVIIEKYGQPREGRIYVPHNIKVRLRYVLDIEAPVLRS